MPRSASEATRFTSTGPYISANPSPSSSSGTQLNFGASAPAGETPQQKIARLRAAAALAKQSKESGFDRTVRVGRLWADRAHRVTAITLIGLTVVTGAVATAGITDMLLHNRRRRNEWLAEKQAETARELAYARKVQAAGASLTEDQIILLNRTRAAEEAALAQKNRPGMFKRATNWLYGGLAEEEQKGGKLHQVAAGSGSASSSSSPSSSAANPVAAIVSESKSTLKSVQDSVNSVRRQGEEAELALRPAGGPLDRQAQLAVDSTIQATRSWTSWIGGR